MSTTVATIRERYLRKLDEFHRRSLRTVEQQHAQALSLLVEAFQDREYIHFPVEGERGARGPLDEVFEKIQDNHVAIEAALAILVSHVNSLEEELAVDSQDLNALLNVLRTEITVRALTTAGQENYERQISESFPIPLTLSPEGQTDRTSAATDVSWEPQDPNAMTWIGDLELSPNDPLAQNLDDLLLGGGEIFVQHVAWSGNADLSQHLYESLIAELDNIAPSGRLAEMSDFFIVSYTGVDSIPTDNPDGGGILKIKLDLPELISHIELATQPSDLIDHVIVINYQGVPTMYEMIENHLFIRPTVVQEIHFHITGGATGQSLDAFFTAVLNYLEVSGGSLHISGYFTDRTSANLRREKVVSTIGKRTAFSIATQGRKSVDAELPPPPPASKPKAKEKKIARKEQEKTKLAREVLSKARVEDASKKLPTLDSDKGRDLIRTLESKPSKRKVSPTSAKTTPLPPKPKVIKPKEREQKDRQEEAKPKIEPNKIAIAKTTTVPAPSLKQEPKTSAPPPPERPKTVEREHKAVSKPKSRVQPTTKEAPSKETKEIKRAQPKPVSKPAPKPEPEEAKTTATTKKATTDSPKQDREEKKKQTPPEPTPAAARPTSSPPKEKNEKKETSQPENKAATPSKTKPIQQSKTEQSRKAGPRKKGRGRPRR